MEVHLAPKFDIRNIKYKHGSFILINAVFVPILRKAHLSTIQCKKPLKRVVVVGCCGAGKSTFARKLANRLQVSYVERDTLGDLGSDAYRSAVAEILKSEAWVFDGPPYYVDQEVYPVAQIVVWLDYSRFLVISRAVWRSVGRTVSHPELGKNQWWRLRQWVVPGGPCFAWQTYAKRKQEFSQLSNRSELKDAKVLRFGRPQDASAWLDSIGN